MRLVVGYAHKYEPAWLIEELRENLAWVDGFVTIDQTDRVDELWSVRADRVAELRRLGVEAGGEWMLIMDPDERLEDKAERVIRKLIRNDPALRFTFHFKELFTPTAYRVDGIWGRKTRRRLFHLHQPRNPRALVDVNIYHLKHIEPGNSELRARVFIQANTWDNHRLGFDYLAETDGMMLEEIPEGRGFYPPYTKPYVFTVPKHLLV